MASNLEPAEKKSSRGFRSFKAELANTLTKDIVLQLATFFDYPPVEIDSLKNEMCSNHFMVRYMEERGQITETDIATLLRALEALNLLGIQKRVQAIFELHTGRCDDQSMQQPEDLNFGKLNLVPIASFLPDITFLGLASFSSADQHNIILENGNHVPVLSALEELQIHTNKGEELTQDQVIGLFSFALKCKRLKKLSFIDCLLPLSLLVGSLSPLTKLRDIEVSWTPTEHGFHLDSSRGKWVSNSKEATTLEIPISGLYLTWSFSGFDGEDIRLESGLSLSSISSLEKISINDGRKNQEFTEEEVIGLINYGIKSPRFKTLRLHNCKLPSSIKPDIIPEESRLRNIKVISCSEARYLDLISGKWRKPDDIDSITVVCSGGLAIHRATSEYVQRSVIEFLVEASNHDIPIFQVNLVGTFSKIDEDGNIILFSGLSLPIITSIERMQIQTGKGREMNKHEVNGILNYVQHSQRFKKLSISQCLLPSSIPIDPSLSALKSRGVEVFWKPDNVKWDEQYLLNFETGGWEAESW
ncbi:uncharacterized protein [Apostichopus japonicus]|uniref:uncharacterized protein isoform X2 n=1 Tax=Stichopus japonicus TaxID=307972 RepID=UPI003AB53358